MYDIYYKELSAYLTLVKLKENKTFTFIAERDLKDIVATREYIDRVQEFENAVIKKAFSHFRNVRFSNDLLCNVVVAPASSNLVALNPDMIIYNPEDLTLDSKEWITSMNLKLKNPKGIYLEIHDVRYDSSNDCYYITFGCHPN